MSAWSALMQSGVCMRSFGRAKCPCLMTKHDILAATTFGQRIAEEEADELVSYFVETDQWQKVISGDVDVVYGPKGSGKSALYSPLKKKPRNASEKTHSISCR